jgi:hypothetical protein
MKRRRQPGKGSFARCVEKVSRRGGVDDPRAVCAAAKMKAGEDLQAARRAARHNPEDLAAEAYERFQGHPPERVDIFLTREHEHEYTAQVGELMELVIVPEGQRKGIRLHGFRGTRLTMNEKLADPGAYFDQLYLVGGDQSVDVNAFGIKRPHEQEVLGKAVDIVYYTTKTHLRPQDGGEADYHHRFAEETAGRNAHLRIVKSPTATYHMLNRTIELWGGIYTLDPEGIRN